MKNSSPPGVSTSAVEVTHISQHGIWLLANDCERFLSHAQFPWFREATIAQVLNVEQPSVDHFYWPDLDVDLSAESIDHPKRFPLKSQAN